MIVQKEDNMGKKIVKVLKMELPGGEAHPGPKLASAGVQMAKFCTDFNAKTATAKDRTFRSSSPRTKTSRMTS
jgi:ribosomal protein L11